MRHTCIVIMITLMVMLSACGGNKHQYSTSVPANEDFTVYDEDIDSGSVENAPDTTDSTEDMYEPDTSTPSPTDTGSVTNDNEPLPRGILVDSGEINNIAWELYNNGLLSISGSGVLCETEEDANSLASIYKKYKDRISNIEVCEGITSIGAKAFYKFWGIENISLPNTLQSIGSNSFYNAKPIKHMEIPDSVTIIEESAFRCAEYLESIKLSNNLMGISENTFRGCTHLKSIDIPDSVSIIGYRAFYQCIYLETVNISSTGKLNTIDKEAFRECESLKSFDLTNIVNYGDIIFGWCTSLSSVKFPDSMEVIPCELLVGCSSIRNIEWPNSVREIGEGAFSGCELTTVILPSSVEKICKGAFSGCKRLSRLELNEGLLYIGDRAFSNCNLLKLTLPSTLKFVGLQAFKDNSNLKEVTILPVEFKREVGEYSHNFEYDVFKDCPVIVVYKYKALVIPDLMFSEQTRRMYRILDESTE